jgi:hypothetical protein
LALPFLEQEPLYNQMNVENVNFGNWGAGQKNPASPQPPEPAPGQTKLTLFRCPGDRGPDLNNHRLFWATSNYRAVTGPKFDSPYFSPNKDLKGIMWHNSKIRFGQITDGTSNTIAIGECMWDDLTEKWAAIWVGMSGVHDGGVYISDVMWCLDDVSAQVNGPAPQAFSSRHTNGCFFGFADGSARFFRQGGDPSKLQWLAGRQDGIIVEYDF